MTNNVAFYEAQQQRFLPNGSSDPNLNYHPETMCRFEDLGKGCGENFPYTRTFPPESPAEEMIDEIHQFYRDLPIDGVQIRTSIEGSLRRADALKLYEMGYFCSGPMLELGTFRGLSTSILSRATARSGKNCQLTTVDLSTEAVEKSSQALAEAGLSENVDFIHANAVDYVEGMKESGKTFGFAFIDHSHAFEAVLGVTKNLSSIINPGGFVMFHDYQDKRNVRESAPDYGVAQAVLEGFDKSDFEYVGSYGCSSLWRRI